MGVICVKSEAIAKELRFIQMGMFFVYSYSVDS